MEKNTGKLIALAAAGLFLAGSGLAVTVNAHEKEMGHCTMKNSCKGKGSCGVKGKNDCSGKNACKGQGWVYIMSGGKKVEMTRAECDAIDGATFKAPEEKKEEKKPSSY
jgi:hypothetical protein